MPSKPRTPLQQLRIGCIGLGRMGQRHATNVAFACPRAQLVAACDMLPANVQWATENLPGSTKVYSSADVFFADPDIDAVLISTETSTHAPLALKALEAGKHVLMEKPVSVDLATAKEFEQRTKDYPHLKVMVAFNRRFDESFMDAKMRIGDGMIGRPYMIQSSCNDQHDPSGFFVTFSAKSGGIFMDMGIHDIDMGRWLLDLDAHDAIKRVYAYGTNVRHPALSEHNDVDNGVGIVEYMSGKSMVLHVGRTAMHGHHSSCEVYGSEAILMVNQNPRMNRVDVADIHGVRSVSTPTYYDRYRESFQREIQAFVLSILNDTAVPSSVKDAVIAGNIAYALTVSYRTGRPVIFDKDGEVVPA